MKKSEVILQHVIQLATNQREAYIPAEGLSPSSTEEKFSGLESSETSREKAIDDHILSIKVSNLVWKV